jgi:hypothetical protein
MVAHGRGARLLTVAIAAAVVAVGALALVGTTSGAGAGRAADAGHAAGVGISKPSPATTAARRRRASADAKKLLSRLDLPAGAVELSHEPSGDGGTLARPVSRPVAVPELVDEHAWWRVPGSAASVLDYLKVHPPRAGRLTQSGSQGPVQGQAVSAFVGFSWPPVATLLTNRQLLVQAVDLSGGIAGVRGDAQVQWIIPRPVSERVPRGVHEIDVTRAAPGESPSLSIKVVSPHVIRALVRMVDAVEIVQPGAYACPMLLAGAPAVTFTFRASDGGTVLASASELASAREPTTACDPMTFSIRGRPQTPPLGGAGVVHETGRLLGVHLQTPPSQQPGSATG